MATDPGAFTIDAMLCDSAVTADGKLYVQGGGWAQITGKTFPFVQPRLALALTLGIPYTSTNQKHDLRLALVNQDGDPIAIDGSVAVENGPPAVVAGAEFAVGRPPLLAPGERQTMPFAVNFDRLRFQSPGYYCFLLTIDDVEINRLEFRVISLGAVTINAG